MADFVDDLKKDILTAMKDVNPTWAEMNALVTLSTLCRNTVIIEREKPMRLNIMALNIGPSGIKKSLPMTGFTLPIIEGIGCCVEKDLILPSRSSVEGMIKYLGEEKDNKKLNCDHGAIIRDEFSGLFRELRNKDWQSDGMEFISEMYDGIFQKRVTVKGGTLRVPHFYGTLISCSTPYFVSSMDYNFFIQGTGNRFLWGLTTAEEYTVLDEDSMDYFQEQNEHRRNDCLEKHIDRGAQIYNLDLQKLYVFACGDEDDAGRIWLDFKKDCETVWKQKSIEDPRGWNYHIIKRYPEFALKLAGLYHISKNFESMVKHPEIPTPILAEDVIRAMSFVEKVNTNFEKIVLMKRTHIESEKPTTDEDRIRAFLGYLMQRKHGMATTMEWYDSVPFGNRNKKVEWKDYCINKGWVEEVPYNKLTTEQQQRFPKNSTVYKYIKGL